MTYPPYGPQYPDNNPQQPAGGYQHNGHQPGQQGQPGQPGQPYGAPMGGPSPYYAMPQNDQSAGGCASALVVLFTLGLPIILLIIGALFVVGFGVWAVNYTDSEISSSSSTSAASAAVTTTPRPEPATSEPQKAPDTAVR